MPASTDKTAIREVLKDFQASERNRYHLGRRIDPFELPDLNQIQVDSFRMFLQEEVPAPKRKNQGLQYLFNSTFPFKSNDSKVRLEFDSYVVGTPRYTIEECLEKDRSFVVPIKCTIRLILEETGEIKEQEIFLADLPYMTDEGTFVINGAVRVVVSQIHRSPGVIFDYNQRANLYHARLIPERGPWLEFEITKDLLYIRIDRKSRILATTLLRAIGFVQNEEILSQFHTGSEIDVPADAAAAKAALAGAWLFKRVNVKNAEGEDELLFAAGAELIDEKIDALVEKGVTKVCVVTPSEIDEEAIVLRTLERDNVPTQEDACMMLYTVVRGSEPANVKTAKNEILRRWESSIDKEKTWEQFDPPMATRPDETFRQIDKSIFFNNDIYSLGSVGRYKINKKFNYGDPDSAATLSPRDIVQTMKHLILVRSGDMPQDDIDHLGNRRIRSVGEQLVNHLKICFSRIERLAKERMTIQDHDTLTPQNLISIKPVTAGIKEFFGTSQLSQFMDQTNPLSAVTHKRRLNALGPGGLTRERAGFEVRDIHYTHYGRMCPIETPEGPNIGLIVSLATYAKINEYGFIETPYYKLKEGKLTEDLQYLSAIEEDRYKITPWNPNVKKDGTYTDRFVPVRSKGDYPLEEPKSVDFMDVAPNQIISISSSLIPFLEHDDANRALMGSNMQRQAVPLLFSEAPVCGTGMEESTAHASGFVIKAKNEGKVIWADNGEVHVQPDGGKKPDVYKLKKAQRTNQDTYYNQRPIVHEGEVVKKGQVLADGPSTEKGELALGKNVLCAFMPWEGYNYEDAILMSENLLKADTYTSIHVEEFEVEARETKLGKEYITRDIPNISEEDFKELDDDGIVRVGAYVRAGSILVGKVTPKGHTEITPEYKLLHSIFGEKAKDVKDTSLRLPHGNEGVVIGIKRYTRDNRDDLKPGVIERIKVYLAKKRKLKVGDKFAGRHGNKGVVARIMPIEDMPFLPDGRPIDVVLNPLGVPSRMNIGQILELILGWAGREMGVTFASPVFNGAPYESIQKILKGAGLPEDGKTVLHDGRTGEPFLNAVTVGVMYYLKLAHLADDKIHARSTGPYSLVTQQPLGGKAQFGGQRVGEMEVWAVEAYGAANILQEFLTVKSDAMEGRTRIYEAIIKGEYVSTPGIPESFNVLVQELRGLALNIEIFDAQNTEISITPRKKEKEKKNRLI
jgi:DNA-directed RNA polymerase subunit beta